MSALKEITVEEAKAWSDAGEAVLVDVREQNEWDRVRIAGAHLNPLSAFDPATIPGHAGKKLVFVCAVGQRSARAAAHMLHEGVVDEAHNMVGGLHAWIEAGFPVEEAE
ncbi:MAG: rhodanese-like domain-containing protein [Rhodospirillales bacterium]